LLRDCEICETLFAVVQFHLVMDGEPPICMRSWFDRWCVDISARLIDKKSQNLSESTWLDSWLDSWLDLVLLKENAPCRALQKSQEPQNPRVRSAWPLVASGRASLLARMTRYPLNCVSNHVHQFMFQQFLPNASNTILFAWSLSHLNQFQNYLLPFFSLGHP